MGDGSIDPFAFVGVLILEKRHAAEHVRWHVLGKPLFHLFDESGPVSILPPEGLDGGETSLVGAATVPEELVVGASDVLWGLD